MAEKEIKNKATFRFLANIGQEFFHTIEKHWRGKITPGKITPARNFYINYKQNKNYAEEINIYNTLQKQNFPIPKEEQNQKDIRKR
jgi:hypothetical protein